MLSHYPRFLNQQYC